MKANLFTLVALLGAGFLARQWFMHTIASSVSRSEADCIEILGTTTTEEEGRTYIIGSVQNHCDHRVSQVTIMFNLQPASDAGTSFGERSIQAYTSNLKAGETRDFKTVLPVGNNPSFRFDGIHAF